jgi:hypothetical protein
MPGDKQAIVAALGEFVGLYCVESPNIRFEDVLRIPISNVQTTWALDPLFLEVCEAGTIDAVGVSSPAPAIVGVEVIGESLRIRIDGELPPYVVVTLSGIRKGRQGVRFPRHTPEQMLANERFWNQARCS